ncbi:winged helix-turn-helix transcriptional regulator [Maribacter sp. PR1]|uniref:Winged helix-turn-helix transcriptional regulator n=1 Tax=Maribacter cobaltidurans TaxID=1178778 RepID=A0ABU7IYG9_9FLAO|nr:MULTISPECIES: winged helix-turn-helix transcriptional regulator [Maribacter]MDC6390642.1 winged helix-turn-helix transcriptional regulator [Maribacter sp. PR1]MEE1978034.1 winged helix-turn-helix transcriptional regulator [Maribacter cobaltidurans]
MEKDGLVKRTVHAEVPPIVDYPLKEIASQLIPIYEELSDYAAKHKKC